MTSEEPRRGLGGTRCSLWALGFSFQAGLFVDCSEGLRNKRLWNLYPTNLSPPLDKANLNPLFSGKVLINKSQVEPIRQPADPNPTIISQCQAKPTLTLYSQLEPLNPEGKAQVKSTLLPRSQPDHASVPRFCSHNQSNKKMKYCLTSVWQKKVEDEDNC